MAKMIQVLIRVWHLDSYTDPSWLKCYTIKCLFIDGENKPCHQKAQGGEQNSACRESGDTNNA